MIEHREYISSGGKGISWGGMQHGTGERAVIKLWTHRDLSFKLNSSTYPVHIAGVVGWMFVSHPMQGSFSEFLSRKSVSGVSCPCKTATVYLGPISPCLNVENYLRGKSRGDVELTFYASFSQGLQHLDCWFFSVKQLFGVFYPVLIMASAVALIQYKILCRGQNWLPFMLQLTVI